MTPRFALAAIALAYAAPALAEGEFDTAATESRLRGCLLAGASSSSQADLRAKVIEVRAFCGAQINRVRDQRTAGVTDSAAKAEIVRKLNAEIAQAIATFSGTAS